MESMEEIIKELKEIETVQTKMLMEMREIVRMCSRGIKEVQKENFKEAEKTVKHVRERLDILVRNVKDYPNFLSYCTHAEQEFAELVVFLVCVKDNRIPSVKEVKVGNVPYLLGMLDAIGELRRSLLDRLRVGDLEEADRRFKLMNELYESTLPIVFSDSILQGFRSKQDVARRQVEQARSEITMAHLFLKVKKDVKK